MVRPARAVFIGELVMSDDLTEIGGVVSYMEDTGTFCCARCAVGYFLMFVGVLFLLKNLTE